MSSNTARAMEGAKGPKGGCRPTPKWYKEVFLNVWPPELVFAHRSHGKAIARSARMNRSNLEQLQNSSGLRAVRPVRCPNSSSAESVDGGRTNCWPSGPVFQLGDRPDG